jgi:hypothetical protein
VVRGQTSPAFMVDMLNAATRGQRLCGDAVIGGIAPLMRKHRIARPAAHAMPPEASPQSHQRHWYGAKQLQSPKRHTITAAGWRTIRRAGLHSDA